MICYANMVAVDKMFKNVCKVVESIAAKSFSFKGVDSDFCVSNVTKLLEIYFVLYWLYG